MACQFNPSGTAGKLTRTANLPAFDSFTICGWIFVRTPAGGSDFNTGLRLGPAGSGNMFLIGEGNTSHMVVFISSLGTQTGAALAANTWHHIALTGTPGGGGTVTLLSYLDGVLSTTNTSIPSITMASFTCGDSYTNDPLTGDLAAVKLYSTALSAAELQAEMTQFAPVRTANLLGWWPLLASTDDTKDYAQGGGDFTATGGIQTSSNPPIPWRSHRRRRVYAVPGGGGPSPLTAVQGTYAVTGQAATLAVGHRLIAAQGAYALTGQAAGLKRAFTLPATQGSYAVTGQSAALRAGHALAAVRGLYSLTGQSAGLKYGHVLVATRGLYAVTGEDANLLYSGFGKLLSAAQGSYAVSGQTARLVVARRLLAGVGSYAVNGQVATLAVGHRVAAAQGTYAVSGQSVNFIRGVKLTAVAGGYTLTGEPAQLRYARRLLATRGLYVVTGMAADLIPSGAPIWIVMGPITAVGPRMTITDSSPTIAVTAVTPTASLAPVAFP